MRMRRVLQLMFCSLGLTFVTVISCKKSNSSSDYSATGIQWTSKQDTAFCSALTPRLYLILVCMWFSLHHLSFHFHLLELPDKVCKGAARQHWRKTSRRLRGIRGADQSLWHGGKIPSAGMLVMLQFQLGVHLRGSRCDITSVSPAFKRSHCLPQKCSSPSDSLVSPGKVPKEVLDSDCPDPVLKESLIWAFHSLTERYQQRCQSLQEQLESADR